MQPRKSRSRPQRTPRDLRGDRAGTTTVEYLMLACLIAIVGLGAWARLGRTLRSRVEGAIHALGGETAALAGGETAALGAAAAAPAPSAISAAPPGAPPSSGGRASSEGGAAAAVSDFLRGAIEGDYGTGSSTARTVGQIAIGFVPVVGQIADVRDFTAALRSVRDGEPGSGLMLAAATVGFVPGIGDGAKAALRGGSGASAATGDVARAVARQSRFDTAVSRLRSPDAAGRFGDDDATAILDGVVSGTRSTIFASSQRMATPPTAAEVFSPSGLCGACGLGQRSSTLYLGDLGVPTRSHQASALFGGGYQHAFAVAEMPNGRRYLVDATFQQFTDPHRIGPRQAGVPGQILRSTEAGRRLEKDLVAHGYVELTDETATLYGRALGGDARLTLRASDYDVPDTLRGALPEDRVRALQPPLR
jgi:Flp pilus assembly pilin Flp